MLVLACVLGDDRDAVPHSAGKHAGRLCVTPHRLLAYRAARGRAAGTPPAAVVLGWLGTLLRKLRACRAVREICGPAGTPA